MNALAKPRFSEAEYLRMERAAETRNEFYRGEIFAMTGASRGHSHISVNLVRELGNQLRKRPCQLFAADMRVRVNATGLYTYPDLAVACAQPQFLDDTLDTLTNPPLIIEILSPSTESYDRGAKFGHYRQIDSLQLYVLVSQDRVLIETFSRNGETWLYQAWESPDAVVPLAVIDCTLRLSDCYEKVEFAPPESPQPG